MFGDRRIGPSNGRSMPPQNRRGAIDVQELMKQELLLQSGGVGEFIADGTPLPDEFSRYANQNEGFVGSPSETRTPSGFSTKRKDKLEVDKLIRDNTYLRETYIHFDSVRKISSPAEFNEGKMRFSIIELNQSQPITEIIEIEVGEFFIPKIENAANFPDYFLYNRIRLEIEELNSQSIRGHETLRFHFEFDMEDVGTRYKLTPVKDKFIFTMPHRDMGDITFRLTRPQGRISFIPDIMDFNIVPGSNPGQIKTTIDHGLTVGSVYSGFIDSFDGPADKTLTVRLLSIDGYNLTVIDATTLEFEPFVDFSPIVIARAGKVIIGENRIAFSLKFRTLEHEITNHVIPV